MSDSTQLIDDAVKTLQAPQSQFGILKLNFFMTGLGIMFLLSFIAAIMYQKNQTEQNGQNLLRGPMEYAYDVSRDLIKLVFVFVIILPALYRASMNITNPASVWSNLKPLIYSFGLASLIPIVVSRYLSSNGTGGKCNLDNAGSEVCAERPTFTKFKDSVLETLGSLADAVRDSGWFNQQDAGITAAPLSSIANLSGLAIIFGLVQRASLKLT